MAEKIFLTEEGKQELEKKLEYLKMVKRPEITERIKIAREFGDLSENAEYDAEVDLRPVETVWCVKAADVLFDIALHNPLRPTIEDAKFALHWLLDARLIDRRTAEERFEKLKQQKFNP